MNYRGRESNEPVPPIIRIVLANFKDVFVKPSASTLTGSMINKCPYRYSPFQRDEIEWQVCDML